MNKPIKIFSIAVSVFLTLELQAFGQSNIAIPGSPKGGLLTELLQSRAYCRSMERQIDKLKNKFPELKLEILSAEASWKSSPFAAGCNNIEHNILKHAGEKDRAMLRKMDEETWAEAKKYSTIATAAEARKYLALVDRRAKGEIEVPMVRGNLLWQYKPFQESPEKEVARGYVQNITHSAKIGRIISFDIPMSWRTEDSPRTELMSFRNCYGHGNIWMTVFVSPTLNELGKSITAQQVFDSYTESHLRTEYQTLGINLTSFLKTKVNGMPALLFSREQPHEQLGERATRSAEVIRVFSDGHLINFQINTLGPENTAMATDRIKRNQSLFKMIGGSLRLTD